MISAFKLRNLNFARRTLRQSKKNCQAAVNIHQLSWTVFCVTLWVH